MLTQQLYKPFDPKITRHRIGIDQFPNSNTTDYRHIVIVRNIMDAMVSGFLYHKSGHECWLSFNGVRTSQEKNFHWEKYLSYHTEGVDIPPRNDRSICRYLVEEDETIAMRVFIDVALSKWYSGVEPYFSEMRKRDQTDTIPRSLVVCFEDYTNLSQQTRLFDESIQFLYPGRRGLEFRIPIQPDANHAGHATNSDPAVRKPLLELVRELDITVFDSSLERLSRLYDCGQG